ncbi:MAG: hypothetical protein AAF614_11805 [Chloroflexota bacterium]
MQPLVLFFATIAILLWLAFVGYGVVTAIAFLQQNRNGVLAFLIYILIGAAVAGMVVVTVWIGRFFF